MKSVLVVYSGGLDSYTLLNKALNEFKHVEAITFDYGQKHNKEITFASKVCSANSIPHEVVKLDLENIHTLQMASFLTSSQNRIFQEKINQSATTDFMKS